MRYPTTYEISHHRIQSSNNDIDHRRKHKNNGPYAAIITNKMMPSMTKALNKPICVGILCRFIVLAFINNEMGFLVEVVGQCNRKLDGHCYISSAIQDSSNVGQNNTEHDGEIQDLF